MIKPFLKSGGNTVFYFLLFWLVFSRIPGHAENQSWLNNSLRISLKPKTVLLFTHEIRNQEFTFTDHYLSNVQGGLECGLSDNTYIAFLYKRENTKKTDHMLNENRFTLESGWKTKLNPKINFDLRFRAEGRTYEQGGAANHLRLRLRLRLTTQVEIGNFTIKPFIATEPFGDTLSKTVHQNRFYLGATFPLGQHSTFTLNYLRQDTKHREPIHILNAGFQLKF
jgi:hypothetical protein